MLHRIVCQRTLVAFIFSLSLFCFQSFTYAQEARGTIRGTVADTSQAVIPDASVRVTDVARGTSVDLKTNGEGIFVAPYLLPGTYQISVEARGFKKFVQTGITLLMNDVRDVPVTLQVGQTTEEVSVNADAPAIRTNPSTGVDVETVSIAKLPLVHGDPYNLIGQSTGVGYSGNIRLDRPFEPTHIVGYTVNGTRGNRSDLMIDGTVSTARANGNEVIASYVPPTDIVQEFKVQTTTYDAQFGNTEGGVTTIGIKPGTNKIHGTGYYGEEPGGLAANDSFAKLQGQRRPFSYSNRYGASVTGPVFLPKIYNGHDKTFFTFGWEGIRDSRPRFDSTNSSVPTQAMINGDFSAFLPLGSRYLIYNPYTRKKNPTNFTETAFPGNIIPANLINPVAQNILRKYFPTTPKIANGAPFQFNNNDSTLTEKTLGYDTFTARMDHNISANHRIFGRVSWYHRKGFYNDYFNNAPSDIATGTLFQFVSRQATFDDVYTFNPTTVLNVKYGYNRFIRWQDMNPAGWGFDLTSVGFPATYNSAIPVTTRRFPRFDITNYQGTGQTNEFRPDDVHSASAVLNKIVGPHSLKMGMEFRSYRQNDIFNSNNETGQFNFDNTYTRAASNTSAGATTQTALAFAAFLLGIPKTGGGATVPANFAEQSISWGFFGQDDWKITRKLTLNIGLRYEIEQPLTERYNKSVTGFDLNYTQPIQGQAQTNYAAVYAANILTNPSLAGIAISPSQFTTKGGLAFAGVNGQSRGLYSTPKTNFMPRVGFSYALTEKTVINGGYGIFYGFLGQRRGDVITTGFSQTTNFIQNIDNPGSVTGCPAQYLVYNTGVPSGTPDGCISTLSNPFPNGILQPVGAANGLQTNLGNAVTYFNQHPLTPYMQRWSFGVQRELFGGIVVRADYVGNRGTHIEIARNLNVTPQQFLSHDPSTDTANRTLLATPVPNPFNPPSSTPAPANVVLLPPNSVIGASTSIAFERLLRPFPEFDTVNTTYNGGYSWYHSGQLSVTKRFSHGYSLQASYTYSKFMQATELLNQDDPRPTRVISDVDFPNRLTITPMVELPFGPNHLFLSKTNGWVSRIVGGWQVHAIYIYQTGNPVGFGNMNYTGDLRSIGLSTDQQTLQRWFNTSGFANGLRVSNVRTFPLRLSSVRVPSQNNIDLSFLKETRVTEGTMLQFRADLINAFNRTWVPGPNVDPTAPNFGQIVNVTYMANGPQYITSAANQANYPRRIQIALKFIF